MEVEEVSGSKPSAVDVSKVDMDPVRVKRKTLQAVLEQCQRALEMLGTNSDVVDGDDEDDAVDGDEVESQGDDSTSACRDREADEVFKFWFPLLSFFFFFFFCYLLFCV